MVASVHLVPSLQGSPGEEAGPWSPERPPENSSQEAESLTNGQELLAWLATDTWGCVFNHWDLSSELFLCGGPQ